MFMSSIDNLCNIHCSFDTVISRLHSILFVPSFPFSQSHGFIRPYSYRHFSFSAISRLHSILFVPSFLLPRNFKASFDPIRTVISPSSQFHGFIRSYSYRHFSFLAISRLHSTLFVPSFLLPRNFRASFGHFGTVISPSSQFQASFDPFGTFISPSPQFHGFIRPYSYRHFSFLAISGLHSTLLVPSFLLPRNFTAPFDPLDTVISPSPQFHGFIRPFIRYIK
jgi:hypothetical protein